LAGRIFHSLGDQVFETIREVKDDGLIVEVAEGVKVKILKTAVATRRGSAAQQKEAAPAGE
jgi:preprotein translocase subunit YajC